MPTSQARKIANQLNAAKSTGPKTVEGKERSRRNGLKHGMTGQGVVVHEGDAAEVRLRDEALKAELAPKSVMGAILVSQMATLSIRMERGAKQEFASVAERVRHAVDDFDAARVEQAERLLKGIGDDPRGNLRKLLKSPEGVDVLVEAWGDLRADLTRASRSLWTVKHQATMGHLLGLRDSEVTGSRIEVLTRATWGDFLSLPACDGAGLDREARQAWARARLLERIDEEIAGLREHRETLDFEAIEQDRAGAEARALFDPSREAGLARRYESEARRGFFRSLAEFRRVEDEAAAQAESAPASTSAPAVEPCAPLASSCDDAPTDPDDLEEARKETSMGMSWLVSNGYLSESEVIPGAGRRTSDLERPIPVPA